MVTKEGSMVTKAALDEWVATMAALSQSVDTLLSKM